MSRKKSSPSMPRPAPDNPKGDKQAGELEQRIARLEERLDHSLLGDDGLALLDKGIDTSASGDALHKAVRRSNARRGSRKA